MIKKYRKKPVIIRVVRWDGKIGTYNEIRGKLALGYSRQIAMGVGDDCLYIDTLEGTMKANIGDYIIKGIKGEIYPCKPDVFESTYEEIKEGKMMRVNKMKDVYYCEFITHKIFWKKKDLKKFIKENGYVQDKLNPNVYFKKDEIKGGE